MKHRKKHIWASIMILLIVAFDQVTKRLAESALMGGKIVTLLPGAVQLLSLIHISEPTRPY